MLFLIGGEITTVLTAIYTNQGAWETPALCTLKETSALTSRPTSRPLFQGEVTRLKFRRRHKYLP